MGTLSLSYKKARTSSGWGSWAAISGSDISDAAVGYHVVYAANLSLTGGQHMTGCTVTTNFVSRGATSTRTITCYMYTFDPTGSSSPPSGYVGYAQYQGAFGTYGVNIQFNFSNLDISSGGTVYFWFNNQVSGASDYQWHEGTNQYTATPYASGTFTAAALSLSLSSTNVTTGGNQVVTIGNGSGRTCTIRVYYGNTQLYAAATSTGRLTIPVTKSWFTTAGITTQTSFSVSVRIDEDSSLYESFTVTAGSDMNPTVTNITTAIVQSGNAATYFPSTYLANISKCKVSATVTAGSNAAIRTVRVTYAGGSAVTLTYNSSTGKYEGTTAALTTSVSFTVTATDARGLTGSGTSSQVTVVQYSKPALNISSAYTYRCDSSGTQESGGAYWRAMATATYYTSLSGNSLLQFKVEISTGTSVNLTSGVQTAVQGGSLNRTTNYTLTFPIQDKVSDPITKTFVLESVTRNVVIKRNSTGTSVGVGTTPTKTAGSGVELPLSGDFLLGGLQALSLIKPQTDALDGSTFGKDFLNINQNQRISEENAGTFFYRPLASISEWSNAPAANDTYAWRGYRFVLWYSTTFQMVVVFEFYPYPGRIWSNFYNGSLGWTGWRYTQALTPST